MSWFKEGNYEFSFQCIQLKCIENRYRRKKEENKKRMENLVN